MQLSRLVTCKTKEVFHMKVVNGFKHDLVHKELSPVGLQVLKEMLDFVERQFNLNRIALEPMHLENELGLVVDSFDFTKCKLGEPGDTDYITLAVLHMLQYDVDAILKF